MDAARPGMRPSPDTLVVRPRLRRSGAIAALALALVSTLLSGCGVGATVAPARTIVVTYSILGAVVKDLVGDAATVVVLIPNGASLHEWEPSAKDIETVTKAGMLVQNGLDLEGGLGNAFEQAEKAGVKRFIAADHISVRKVEAGEGADPADPDQAPGADDPHLWMDPLTMKDVVAALATQLRADLGLDVSTRAADLATRLTTLNDEVAVVINTIPADRRKLVTGHESLGYFAQRYGMTLIGAIIPSVSSSAQASAADLAALAAKVKAAGVPAVFTELGNSPDVAKAIGDQTGAKVVEITTHALPADGTYASFLKNLAATIADNLR